MSKEERRMYKTQWQRTKRQQKSTVDSGVQKWTVKTHTDTDTDTVEERERGAAEKPLPETPPITRKDFDVLADARGIPPECAEWFWNTHDARNWTDATGQPIRKVEPLLRNALTNWRAKQSQAKPANGTAQLILDQRKLDRVEAEMKRLRSNYESHQDMSTKDKTKLRGLKAERKQLMDSLGMTV
jgi:hypothetical protein